MAKNKNNDQRRTYDVHLDDALLGIQEQVGHLHRNLRVADLPASFEYLKSWENHPARFMLGRHWICTRWCGEEGRGKVSTSYLLCASMFNSGKRKKEIAWRPMIIASLTKS